VGRPVHRRRNPDPIGGRLARALGDNQRVPEYIETIPKRGYRLIAEVSGRIADRLASARRRRFVGREQEIEIVRSALQSAEPSFVAPHLTGAGGVGKTTLLQEFARAAHEAARAVVRIDGRNIEASPLGFLVALGDALGADRCDVPAVVERWPAGGVLLIDTYERLAPIDDWLRDTLLPQLPARSLDVFHSESNCAAKSADGTVGAVGDRLDLQTVP
jgi:AAA ATPase domain